MKQLTVIVLILLAGVLPLQALELTRYVSADATGDGLTPETPMGSLQMALNMSVRVDGATIYITPGLYKANGDFPNIQLYGVKKLGKVEEMELCSQELSSDIDETKKPVLIGETNFTNSSIYSVDAKGSISVNSGSLSYCTMTDRFNSGTADQVTILNGVYGSGGQIGGQINLFNCAFVNNKDAYQFGLNLSGEGHIFNCRFNGNKGGGLFMHGCDNLSFYDCEFADNEGIGAIESNSTGMNLNFINCKFINNKKDRGDIRPAVTVHSATFCNCFFFKNDSEGYGPALMATSSNIKIVHCAFINNGMGFHYEGGAPEFTQIINTVFWNNGSLEGYDITRPRADAYEPKMYRCALPRGTGIPELDKELGIICLSLKNNGTDPNENYLAFDFKTHTLRKNSALINAGILTDAMPYDIYNNSRIFFDMPDIGPFEFVGDSVIASSTTFTLKDSDGNDWKMGLGTTEFRDRKYHVIYPNPEYVEAGKPLPSLMNLTFAGFGDKGITQYGSNLFNTAPFGGGYSLNILSFNGSFPLNVKERYEYTSASKAPTVRKAQKPNTVIITADGKNNYFSY